MPNRTPGATERVPVGEFRAGHGPHRIRFGLREGRFTAPDDAQPARIEGYACVFDVLSDPMADLFGTYQARVLPGAFSDVLNATPDTRLLINHDPNRVLARTVNSTLTLTQDDRGLSFVGDPADTSYARDLRVLMDRGDVTQCSFSFDVEEDAWIEETASDGTRVIWELRQFAALDDVAVVTYPAFPQTSARTREFAAPRAQQVSKQTHRRLALAAAQVPRRTV